MYMYAIMLHVKQKRAKQKRPPDPSKPLSNVKHEIFANMMVKNKGNQAQSYVDTYGAQTKEHAPPNASRLLTNDTIHQRVEYILRQHSQLSIAPTLENLASQQQATKPYIIEKEAHLYPDNAARASAIGTTLKLHGLLKDNSIITNNIQQNTVALMSEETLSKVIGKLEELNAKFNAQDNGDWVIKTGGTPGG